MFFFIPKTSLYVTFDAGVKIEVKDTTSWIPGFPAQRYIQIDGKGYYSAIYIDNKRLKQPYLRSFQETIELWTKEVSPKCALILGSAGCALHRFLALTYEGISITGIELSATMIDIAERFFMNNIRDKVQLVQANAIQYLDEIRECRNYDIVVVDLFIGDKVVPQIHSAEFLYNLYSSCRQRALLLFNLYGDSDENVQLISSQLSRYQPLMKCEIGVEGHNRWLICHLGFSNCT